MILITKLPANDAWRVRDAVAGACRHISWEYTENKPQLNDPSNQLVVSPQTQTAETL